MTQHRHNWIMILVGLGLAAGVLGGLLGIGGGALVVPGLVFFLGFGQHKAHGTSLAAVLLLAGAGVATYTVHGYVDYRIALEIAVGGVVGAMVGARVANLIHAKALRRIFSVFILLVAAKMIFDGLGAGSVESAASVHPIVEGNGFTATAVIIGIGLLTGFMSSLLGIGGGMVMIPALVILLSMPQKMAQGISLAAMIPTALAGVYLHRKMGNVDVVAGTLVGVGGAVGAVVGGQIVASVEASSLKIGFGVFLITMAALMAIKKSEPAKEVGVED